MNLTKEQTQFIDQYLKKSEVVFDDLRIELLDHVASAVCFKMVDENLDFYDAFKYYMVENKKSILKAGMVNHTFNFKLAISKFTRFLISKEVLIFSVIFLFLCVKTFNIFLFQHLEIFQTSLIATVFSFSIIWILVFYGVLRKRIFALENNIILLTIYYYIVNFSTIFWRENIEIEFYITLFSALFIALFIAFMLKTSFTFYSRNKNLYEIR